MLMTRQWVTLQSAQACTQVGVGRMVNVIQHTLLFTTFERPSQWSENTAHLSFRVCDTVDNLLNLHIVPQSVRCQ